MTLMRKERMRWGSLAEKMCHDAQMKGKCVFRHDFRFLHRSFFEQRGEEMLLSGFEVVVGRDAGYGDQIPPGRMAGED